MANVWEGTVTITVVVALTSTIADQTAATADLQAQAAEIGGEIQSILTPGANTTTVGTVGSVASVQCYPT